MKKIKTFSLDHGKKYPTDDKAIDSVMEVSEEWEAPTISSNSSFYTNIASRIYKDFNSGIRELYNNEARACRTARREYGARPRIEIKIDFEERKLTIHGVDSLGISEEIFKQVIKQIGESGNISGKEVGMFGMGFVSYQMLTDLMILYTWTREETESESDYMTVFCKEDLKTKRVVEKQPSLDTFGTKLEMILKDEVVMTEIIETFKGCSKFSTVPTTIEIINSDNEDLPDQRLELEQYKNTKEWFSLNNRVREYTHEGAGILEIQKFDSKTDKQMKSIFVRNRPIDFIHKIEYSDEDIEFYGVLAMCKELEFDDDGKRTDIYSDSKRMITGKSVRDWDDDTNQNVFLVGVPIEATVTNTPYGSKSISVQDTLDSMDWVINIKNERKYMPNANRDGLERKAEESVSVLIAKIIRDSFQKYNIKTASDYKNSINKTLYSQRMRYDTDVMYLVDDVTAGIVNTLNQHFPTPSNNYGSTLESLINKGSKIISLQSLRGDIMSMFVKHFKDNDISFIRCKDHDKMPLLKQWGVIIGEEYKAINKLKIKHGKRGKTGQVILDEKRISLTNSGRWNGSQYFGGRGSHSRGRSFSTTIGQVNKQNECLGHRMIQFNNDKDEYKAVKDWLDWNSGSDIIVMCRERKGLKIDTPEMFVSWFRKQPLLTTKGKQTIEQLEAIDNDKIFYLTEGLPELNKEEKIETLAGLLDEDPIFAWLTNDMVLRLGMYNKLRHGGIGYPKLRGKGISVQGIKILFNHGVKEAETYVGSGRYNNTDEVDRILNYYKTRDLFENEYDRLILDTMVKATRNGDIPDEDETSITNIVIKRLNLE